MNDATELVSHLLALANDRKWWALAALVIGTVVRLSKLDVRWFPNVDARWRPAFAALLGVALGGLDKIVAGETWQQALTWGLSASAAAILGHVFFIESARGGKELPMPGAIPPPPAASLIVLVLPALLAFGPSSCTKIGNAPPFNWPAAVSCGPDIGEAIGKVTQILVSSGDKNNPLKLSQDGEQQLTQLATEYGAAAVLCLVDQLVRDWSSPGAAAPPWRAQAARRGLTFIDGTRTQIQHAP